MTDELVHIQRLLFSLHPLNHAVQHHERPCAPHPCTAVHQQRGAFKCMGLPHPLDKVDEAGFVGWDTMVWPGSEVEVSNLERDSVRFASLVWG